MDNWPRLWNASAGQSQSAQGLNVPQINAFFISRGLPAPTGNRSAINTQLRALLETIPEALAARPGNVGRVVAPQPPKGSSRATSGN